MFLKIVLFGVLSFFTVSEAEIQLIPASESIDVIEGNSFTIEMINDAKSNISHCYYQAGAIIGDFEIEFWEDEILDRAETNVVTNYGAIGKCKIKVENVASDIPAIWEFVAFDLNSTRNFSASLTVTFFYKRSVLWNPVNVRTTGAFLQYLILNETVNSCYVGFNGIRIELEINSNEIIPPPNMSNEDKNITDRMKGLGGGLCGFKLTNLVNTDPKNWNLTATDPRGNRFGESFIVQVFDVSPVNQKILKKLGDPVSLYCGLEDTQDQDFCYLYNPAGELVFTGDHCNDYFIQKVKMSDGGTWRCTAGIRGAMDMLEYSTELILLELESVDVWVQETDDHFEIGCTIKNYKHTSDANYCEFTAPNKESLLVRPGYATERYTSISTNLSQFVCGIEIQKPIQNYERGVWKCAISGTSITTGGFAKLLVSEIPDYPTESNQTVLLNKPFAIQCNVPFSSEYCFIQAPNSSKYDSDVYKARLGECSLNIEKASPTDNGDWTCSFARTMGTPNELITVQVHVAEEFNHPYEEQVSLGGQINLMCSSQGIALKYCQYISPTGETYFIHNHAESDILSYRGRGLEYGDCGVTIKSAELKHVGRWVCVTRLVGMNTPELTAGLTVTILPQATSTGTSAGISIGVVGAIGGVVAFLVYRRKKQQRLARVALDAERNSGSSGSNSPIFDVANVSRRQEVTFRRGRSRTH